MARRNVVARGEKSKVSARTGKKKMPGKSAGAPSVCCPTYKPSIYLDDKQIPAGLENAKVGSKVTMQVEVKVTSKSEHEGQSGTSRNIALELQSAVLAGRK